MTDTPRTDAAEAFDDDGRMVSASFGRRLEREITSLTDRLSDRDAKLRLCRASLIDYGGHKINCDERANGIDGDCECGWLLVREKACKANDKLTP